MKVKDVTQPLLSGRMGNLIFYVRNGQQCVRRVAVSMRKKQKERTPAQKAVTGRFFSVQIFYSYFCKKVSPEIWRRAAQQEGKMAHNLFHSVNSKCFGVDENGRGSVVDFERFQFSQGCLSLPREIRVEAAGDCWHVTWKEERSWSTAAASDRLMVGVMNSDSPLQPRLASFVSGRRGDGCGDFMLDEKSRNGAHVYFFFAREDGSAYSDCAYFYVAPAE